MGTGMKTFARILLASLALAFGSNGWGQAGPFTKYGPVAGVQFNTGLTYVDTAATAAQLAATFCGTSTTLFLRADGNCAAPPGGVSLSTANTWTALQTFNAGIAGSGLTAHGVLIGEGASAVVPVVMGADTVLRGTASADPVAAAVPNCGSGTTALNYNTTTHAFGCQTLTGATLANPTALVGLTAVNGTATSAIRSDGAPALDQSIVPTMTGTWVFTPSSAAATALTINQNTTALGQLITGSSANPVFSRVQTSSASNGAAAGLSLEVGTDTSALEMYPAATTPAPLTGGPTGEQVALASNQNVPLVIGTNGNARVVVGGAGNVTINAPTSGNSLTATAPATSAGFAAIFISGTGASGTQDGVGINAGSAAADTAFIVNNQTGSTSYFKIDGAGTVAFPQLVATSSAQAGTMCVNVSKQINYDTTTTCLLSARRYKQNITDIDVGLDEVMKLRPVSYDLRPEYNPSHLGPQLGLIAEEVGAVDSRLEGMTADGKQAQGVRYMQLTAVLVKAVQEQQREIRALILIVMLMGAYLVVAFLVHNRGRRRE